MKALAGVPLLVLGLAWACAAGTRPTGPDPRPFQDELENSVNKALRDQLIDEATDKAAETPMQVRVLEFVPGTFRIKGPRADGEARVAIQGVRRETTATWTVEFEQNPFPGGPWRVAKIAIPPPAFGTMNYGVVLLYLLGMLGIGWWSSRRIHGTRSFFIADGKLNHIVVGISIMTTYLSAITMMALPASAFSKKDWTWAIQLPFLLITAFVITRFVLPRYRESGVISIYQLLEQRIHVWARLLASSLFVVFSVGRMGLVLYLPALAFHIITGFPLLWTIVISGAVVTIYTVMGGIEAVTWTDMAQAAFIITGAAVTVVYVLVDVGLVDFARVTGAYHKFRLVEADFPSLDLTKTTALWLILETIFQTIRIYGTQQDMAQRYMTTSSTRKANISVWISIVMYIPLGFAFYFIGSALFAYYSVIPSEAIPALIRNGRADAIYPFFVAAKLPAGLSGLVVAAISAAAMSSIAPCMNSNSTVCVEDFYRRFTRKERTDEHYLAVAQWLTLAWGILATVMAISLMEITKAQDVWAKIMSICTNGILGLMALAFLPWRVNRWAALIGFGTSYLGLFTLMWWLQIKPHVALVGSVSPGTGVHFLLWPVIGNIVCFGVALGVDAAARRLGGGPGA